ncbi:LTA synthase family protein [Pasteurellaceae bacterium LIM206]|nr:LTA synthase family protein [Pasteurellaceae bacterium LIM206]
MTIQKPRSIFFPVLCFIGINLTILSLFRFGLSLWQADRVNAVNGWGQVFLQGIRMDVVTMSWLFGLPALLNVLLFYKNSQKWHRTFLRLWLTVFSVFLLFMELATPAFIATYDFRPNRLFLEYLLYPKEVFSMLGKGHPLATVLSLVLSVVSAVLFWRVSGRATQNIRFPKWQWRPVLVLCVIALTVLGGRSTLANRGINPAMVAFSSDGLVNSLVLNSGYSVLYAANQLKSEEISSEVYGEMSVEEMLQRVKANRPAADYISEQYPTLSRNRASYQGKPRNIVIILEESFGAQFVGTLGGKNLTPEFDKLARQGWLFDNLYATGTRSVRGIEALVSGFTPTPARSTVKLTKSQTNFFSIAEILKQQGYDTSFIYGGEKHFDNMASFFYGNGFTRIIDQNDYKNPEFSGIWGVSDEDLFRKANDTFNQLHQQGKPFFSLVFSSSNHDPFEFPDGKIELVEHPKATVNNAVKYADYAIGQFFRMAKQSDYWQDTIFLVIADHDARAYGASLLPVEHFHIPALILGSDIQPRRDNRLVSQFDMPTTLLSLAGVNADYPMIGYDLTQDVNPNRAIMQFNQTQGMMRGHDLVILRPKIAAQGFEYNPTTHRLTEKTQPEAFKKDALAHALLGSYLYKEQKFRAKE